MRTAAIGVLAVPMLTLATACDPVVGVQASVVIPPDAIAAYAGAFPAQVLVTDDHDTHQIGAPPHAHRIAVLCQKSDAAQQLRYARGGIGCAEETHLVAYVAPLSPAEAGGACGPLAEPKFVEAPPPVGKPAGRATVFAGVKGECGNHEASASITMAASP